jgi:hypothetical protein
MLHKFDHCKELLCQKAVYMNICKMNHYYQVLTITVLFEEDVKGRDGGRITVY